MATNNGRGIPSISSALMRPSSPTPPSEEPAPEPSPELEENDAPAEQGRGGAEPRATTTTASATRPRRRRATTTTAAEKPGKRGLYLTDGVWERLQLEAIRKKTTISAVCEDVLARNLARLRIERDA